MGGGVGFRPVFLTELMNMDGPVLLSGTGGEVSISNVVRGAENPQENVTLFQAVKNGRDKLRGTFRCQLLWVGVHKMGAHVHLCHPLAVTDTMRIFMIWTESTSTVFVLSLLCIIKIGRGIKLIPIYK